MGYQEGVVAGQSQASEMIKERQQAAVDLHNKLERQRELELGTLQRNGSSIFFDVALRRGGSICTVEVSHLSAELIIYLKTGSWLRSDLEQLIIKIARNVIEAEEKVGILVGIRKYLISQSID